MTTPTTPGTPPPPPPAGGTPPPGFNPSGTPAVVTAAIFSVSTTALTQTAWFAELGSINSELESTEYIVGGGPGQPSIIHSRQFGKTKPPTITLKRGVDGTGEIWGWHLQARLGDDNARHSATLAIMDASGKVKGSYILSNCWPTKVEVSGAKAGSGEVVYETVTLTCDEIVYEDENKKLYGKSTP